MADSPDAAPKEAAQWQVLANAIGDQQDADVILYNGGIDHDSADEIIKLAKRPHRRKNVVLLLTTRGGNADAGFRLARGLQTHYTKFTVYIYGRCKSAGTLVAVGADEVILSDYGEFGPLDVQLGKQDELFENTSGLDINQALISLNQRAFEFFRGMWVDIRYGTRGQISTKFAAEIASSLSVGVYGRIYEQIEPNQLGMVERAMRIAIRYGERLAKKNLKKGALEKLATGYPSHSFVIDLIEAQTLFEKVRAPTNDEENLGECISHLTRDQQGNDDDAALVFLLNPPAPAGGKSKESQDDSGQGSAGARAETRAAGRTESDAIVDKGAAPAPETSEPAHAVRGGPSRN
jgi:hypothetical protein